MKPKQSEAPGHEKIQSDRMDVVSVSEMINKPVPVTDDLAQIRSMLAYLTDSIKEKEKDRMIEDEWKALSLVLDRIFFWITFITALVMIPTFLIQDQQSEIDVH